MKLMHKGCNNDVIYKHMHWTHAKSMVEKGEFKIGTLFEYQNIESHGQEIHDKGEGTKHTYSFDNPEDWATPERNAFLRNHYLPDGPPSGALFKDNLVVSTQRSTDMYIFCTSKTYNPLAMFKMGYEVTVKIDNRDDIFFRTLTAAINKHLELAGDCIIANVVYGSRWNLPESENNIPPAFIKLTKFAYQEEVRMAWFPKHFPIAPGILTCLDAVDYCSLVSKSFYSD